MNVGTRPTAAAAGSVVGGAGATTRVQFTIRPASAAEMPASSGDPAVIGVFHTAADATAVEFGVPLLPPLTTWKNIRNRVEPAGIVTSNVASAPSVVGAENTVDDTDVGVTSTGPGPENTLVLITSVLLDTSSAVTIQRSAVVKLAPPLKDGSGVLTAEKFDQIVRPEKMTAPGAD